MLGQSRNIQAISTLTRVTCRGHNSLQKMLLRPVALVSELIQTTKVCLDSQAPWNTQHVKRRCLVMGSVYPH